MIGVMKIEINETAKAFNETTGADKALAKYLTIVPFLGTSYEHTEDAPEHVKYGAFKAKRLYVALGLNEDNSVPFMLMCVAQSGADPTMDGIKASGKEALQSFGEGGFAIPATPTGKKPTLH